MAALFLRLGCTAFGGPASHIAMMEDEVVVRRQWLTCEEFLDLLGATNLIPGPNSTEMAIHIGHRRAGWAGLLVAGVCFVAPAVLIVSVLAWFYVRFGSVPRSIAILHWLVPVVLAIVAQAVWRLGRSLLKSWLVTFVAAGALLASAMGLHELVVLALGGLIVAHARTRTKGAAASFVPLGVGATATTTTLISTGLLPLFVLFLKIGSVVFGSGYVLLAFLRSDLVEHYHWITNTQLLDAVAIGQITPGPVFTAATFIGWILRGPIGALVATVGIFLPAFVLVALSGPLVPRLRRAPVAAAFLDGVNAASLALMALVTCQLGKTALTSGWTIAFAAASLFVLLSTRLSSTWLLAVGAILGVLTS